MTSPSLPDNEQLPGTPSAWQLLTSMNAASNRWPGALRSALALLLPGLIALVAGSSQGMLMVAAGACAVIYGEGRPFRVRWRVILIAGTLLTLGTVAGSALGHVVFAQLAGGNHWWYLLIGAYATAIATTGAFVQNALRLPPPGAFFIVMTAGGATMSAKLGLNPFEVGGWTLLGVASSLIVGMTPWLVHPHLPEEQAVTGLEKAVAALRENPTVATKHQAAQSMSSAWSALSDAQVVSHGRVTDPSHEPLVDRVRRAQLELSQVDSSPGELSDDDRLSDTSRTVIPHARPTMRYRIYRAMSAYSHPTITAAQVLIAALGAVVISVAFGFDRPDWAAVSAMLILQWGPDRVPGSIRGVHRFLGTIGGIALFAGLHILSPGALGVLVVLTLCQFGAEILVVRNYALCVIVTTPLALLMGGSLTKPLGSVVVDRFFETAIAVACSLAVIWLTPVALSAKHHAWLVKRCRIAMSSLLGALLTQTPNEAIHSRRDLQYELLSERWAIASLARNDRATALSRWSQHVSIQQAGYRLFDACTASPTSRLDTPAITSLADDLRRVSRVK